MSFARKTWQEVPPTLRLAAPITAGHVGQMLMGVADTLMIGHVGTLPLAACAFANNIILVLAVGGFGLLTGVSVRVSHAHGAGLKADISRALYAALLIAIFSGVLAALILHGSYPWFHHFGQAPGVLEEAHSYTLIVGWSMVPAFLISASRNYLDAQSCPWPAFWILLGGVLLNVFLNWVLIYGNLGFPPMELTGAGWATLVSRVATVAGLIWYVWSSNMRPRERLSRTKHLPGELIAQLRLGLPAGTQLVAEIGAFTGAALLIGHLGAIPLAAHQVALTCASTTFMFPLGVAMASTVRIAQAKGAGRTNLLRPIAAGSWAIGIAVMALFAVLFLFANRPIARAFIEEIEVVQLAASLLVIAGIFQLVDGVQVIGTGLLRGLRDTTGPMLITIAAYWVVALPLGSWLAFRLQLGAQGMWIGLALGLGVAAALLVGRFVSRSRPAPSQ